MDFGGIQQKKMKISDYKSVIKWIINLWMRVSLEAKLHL